MGAEEKAYAFATSFEAKFTDPVLSTNRYSSLVPKKVVQAEVDIPDRRAMKKIFDGLKEDCATGPDNVPVRILKKYAEKLSEPMQILVTRVIECGQWPEIWRKHWIVPR